MKPSNIAPNLTPYRRHDTQRQTHRQPYRLTDRQTNTHTNRVTHRQTDRQTDTGSVTTTQLSHISLPVPKQLDTQPPLLICANLIMDSGADTDAAGDGGHADGVSSIFSSMQARHTPLHSPVLSYFYPLSLLLFVSHYVTLIPSYLSPALSSMHHSYSQLILPPASIPAPLSKADNRFICHVQVS